MLPEIQGAKLRNFPWNAFVLDLVLDYYDGPRILLQRSKAGQLYLAWWNDEDDDTDRWLYLPLSEERLHEVLSGSIPALDALNNPEDGNLLVVDIDVNTDTVARAVATTAAALPQDSLPLEWVRLDMPVPAEVSSPPGRKNAHSPDVSKVETPSRTPYGG